MLFSGGSAPIDRLGTAYQVQMPRDRTLSKGPRQVPEKDLLGTHLFLPLMNSSASSTSFLLPI